MNKKMLIDAAHPEQTRVAIVDGNRVEEFDFESQSKKQLRGNIYLAKITRVEASLQAAFVDYGGNRHGFLAFNEIHPDYYQIPVEDRERLLRQESEEDAEDAAIAAAQEANGELARSSDDESEDESDPDSDDEQDETLDENTDAGEEAAIAAEAAERRNRRRKRENRRRYRIQEVIKSGQILLVQISKEERGTKGAALTSYLSLAGRYCVLMPNTARGGGISRKISNAADRNRLKTITEDLELPKSVGLIIRTAGSKRTKVEIKRDYEYLGRLWSTIREKTLESMSPALVHEEGGLVRRAVRDLYDKEIEAVFVEGEAAYHEAHDFMKMLMPSHAVRVKQYKGTYPIFLEHQVEDQLEAIYNPNARLKSGGYLVINQTEALVAIDVNSGRSTKERNIEATALKTNLEAADEACRQMRLRDLAGLVVIDFIDMDENKNIRAVEKRMKDALKRDRARIQVGRISSFGLMELSRQRRRASVIEGTSQVCPTCAGIGVVRSIESAALSALQALEAEAMKGQAAKVRLTTPTKVSLYLLNEKREFLASMERDLNMLFSIDANPAMYPPQFEIEVLEKHKSGGRNARVARTDAHAPAHKKTTPDRQTDPQDKARDEQTQSDTGEQREADASAENAPKKRRRGRRGGRGRHRNSPNGESAQTETAIQTGAENTALTDEASAQMQDTPKTNVSTDAAEAPAKPKRRARRRSKSAEGSAEPALSDAQTTSASPQADAPVAAPKAVQEPKSRPMRRRRPARSALAADGKAPTDAPEQSISESSQSAPEEVAKDAPKRRAVRSRKPKARAKAPAKIAPAAAKAVPSEEEDAPKRRAVRSRKPKARAKAPAKIAPIAAKAVPSEAKDAPKRRAVRSRKPTARAKAPAKTAEIATLAETGDDSIIKGWWSRRFKGE